MASLLKTADDLKIKGLAEVSWRDDEEGGPTPTPATEFQTPSDIYAVAHEAQLRASPATNGDAERKSDSPVPSSGGRQHAGMPTLTPIPQASNGSITFGPAAACSPVDQYLGPKRKRGRPPLDDAYDVFNV